MISEWYSRIQFVGKRFHTHTLPLGSIQVLELYNKLINDLANFIISKSYNLKNETKQRIESSNIELHLSFILPGSTIAQLELVEESPINEAKNTNDKQFEKNLRTSSLRIARELISYWSAASQKFDVEDTYMSYLDYETRLLMLDEKQYLDPHILYSPPDFVSEHLDMIAKKLLPGEKIIHQTPFSAKGIPLSTINKKIFREYSIQADYREFKEQVVLRSVSIGNSQIMVEYPNGRKIRHTIIDEDMKEVQKATNDMFVDHNSFHLEISGTEILNPLFFPEYQYQNIRVRYINEGERNSPTKATTNSPEEQLGANRTLKEAMNRLDELSQLQFGWFEGTGKAISQDHIIQLKEEISELAAIHKSPIPYLYPTTDGGIQAEWTLGDWEISAEFNFDEECITLLAVDISQEDVYIEEKWSTKNRSYVKQMAVYLSQFKDSKYRA